MNSIHVRKNRSSRVLPGIADQFASSQRDHSGLKKLEKAQDHVSEEIMSVPTGMLACVYNLGNLLHGVLSCIKRLKTRHWRKIAANRPKLVEHSAAGDLTVPDYIVKGSVVDDVTTLPRFFEASRHGKEEALRCTSTISGFCGLAVTRRGIAIRSWTKDLKGIRQSVMSTDPRITEENLAAIPRLCYESGGWPSSITPSQVVRAIAHETKSAPVPTRFFRSLGLSHGSCCFRIHLRLQNSLRALMARRSDTVTCSIQSWVTTNLCPPPRSIALLKLRCVSHELRRDPQDMNWLVFP